MRDKKKEATFAGNVKVIQGDTTMTSKSLVVFYDGGSTPAAPAANAKGASLYLTTSGGQRFEIVGFGADGKLARGGTALNLAYTAGARVRVDARFDLKNGTVLDLGGALADHDHRVDEPRGALIGSALRFAPGAPGAQGGLDLALEAAAGLEYRVIGRFVRIGTETTEAHPDDVRLDGLDVLIVDSQLAYGLRKGIHREDVDIEFQDEIFENLLGFGLGQIQSERFLAGVEGEEVAAHRVLTFTVRLPDAAVGIGELGVLKTDNAGPLLSEAPAQIRKDGGLLHRKKSDVAERVCHV